MEQSKIIDTLETYQGPAGGRRRGVGIGVGACTAAHSDVGGGVQQTEGASGRVVAREQWSWRQLGGRRAALIQQENMHTDGDLGGYKLYRWPTAARS